MVIDVVAHEGMGARTGLTTIPPGRTLQVPGGTQALRRSEDVKVVLRYQAGFVSRPSLLGAFVVAERLERKDRQRLRLAAALDDSDHPA